MIPLAARNLSYLTPITVGAAKDGVSNSYSGYFNGYISNFRIIKGTALYTGSFTPPASSLPSGFSSNKAYGESVTVNGSEYAFLKANSSLSYLVPKR